jgi:protein-S-isoprenylcysteine O-methyltransferase Ste14
MALRENLEKQGTWLFRYRSYLPLFVVPLFLIALQPEYLQRVYGDLVDDLYESLCIVISFSGLAIRCLTIGYVPKGTSGRITKKQKAEILNMTGMYSIVRHPLYLGNFLIFLGLTLFIQVWWFTLLSILMFWLYYERIIFAEEEFLRYKFGDVYMEWANKTPAFIPKLKKWQRPNLSFSFKNILRREYTGFFVITSSYTFLEITEDVLVERKLEIDPVWMTFFITGLTIYLILRTLKRKTKILDVEGR